MIGQSDAQTRIDHFWKSIVLGEILEIYLFLSGKYYINIVILKRRLIFISYMYHEMMHPSGCSSFGIWTVTKLE